MTDITILILTKNEEKNIADVIKNAKRCAEEVLVVDSGSTDSTVELAKENGARVLYRAWDDDFAAQRNFALEHTKTKWVLYLDADERLNDELIESVKKAGDAPKQYIIKRKSVAFSQEFNYGVLRPDYVARLFPRDKVRWENRVHEKAICDLPKCELKGYAKHYTYTNWEQYFNKFNQYTTIWAQNAYQNGKTTNIAKAFLHATGGFFQMAFLKKGICDGKLGFVLCCNHFFYTLIKYVKLYYIEQNKDIIGEKTGDKQR